MTRVVIIQPMLPQYRVPFFESLTDYLARKGVELVVAHGLPSRSMRTRGDSRAAPWAVELPTHSVGRGRALVWHRLAGLLSGTDLVVAEQALRNVETYALVARSVVGLPRLALWGHGRTYTKQQSACETSTKNWLTLRSSWFFAYTEGGAEYVTALGFPSDRVTVVQNSVDTEVMQRQVVDATAADRSELAARLGLSGGRLALYVGALEAEKRLDFLIEAASRVAATDKSFSLVVAGAGALTSHVEAAAGRHPWLTYVGPVFGRDKAILASMSDVILMPGRVGLAAVDSFATGAPVVTTEWPYHAPEFEYLQHGVNAWVTRDELDSYASGVHTVWRDAELRSGLVAGCGLAAKRITLSAMVQNFGDGVLSALTM